MVTLLPRSRAAETVCLVATVVATVVVVVVVARRTSRLYINASVAPYRDVVAQPWERLVRAVAVVKVAMVVAAETVMRYQTTRL